MMQEEEEGHQQKHFRNIFEAYVSVKVELTVSVRYIYIYI